MPISEAMRLSLPKVDRARNGFLVKPWESAPIVEFFFFTEHFSHGLTEAHCQKKYRIQIFRRELLEFVAEIVCNTLM